MPTYENLAFFWAVIANTWWMWMPFLTFYMFRETWRWYLRSRYFANLKWVTIEVRLPREIPKGPEAMEEVWAGLQTMYFGFDPEEKWWQGLQHDYISFELASFGGDTHFYIRSPAFFKNVVEAQVYSQYPDIELVEVEDYMSRLPEKVPTPEWDLFGVEFKLTNKESDAFPIRTYRDFQKTGVEAEEQVDPFGSIIEGFGKIEPGEFLIYHLLARPMQTEHNELPEKAKKLVAKLVGRKLPPEKSRIEEFRETISPATSFVGDLFKAVTGAGEGEEAAPEKKEDYGTTLMQHLTTRDRERVEGIEKKMSQPIWEAIPRFCYIAQKKKFHYSHLSNFIGGMRQYNKADSNGLYLQGESMATTTPWYWPKKWRRHLAADKKKTYFNYLRIRKPFTDTIHVKSKFIHLSVEEMATIFHYPSQGTVKAPMLQRVESKRAEPPATLPVG
jgi:hypothetical protein